MPKITGKHLISNFLIFLFRDVLFVLLCSAPAAADPAAAAALGAALGGASPTDPHVPPPAEIVPNDGVPTAVSSPMSPLHESMQPLAATKPEPKPIQQPTAVLLHATEKNVRGIHSPSEFCPNTIIIFHFYF